VYRSYINVSEDEVRIKLYGLRGVELINCWSLMKNETPRIMLWLRNTERGLSWMQQAGYVIGGLS
jgi:hypothetical protein